jgi:hypothetical protein
MATLVSTTVTQPQTGVWPQVMTIVQEFDQPVIGTSDFKLVFYTKSDNPFIPAEMVSTPVQFVPSQLTYTIQVSPFANGQLGVLRQIGSLADLYGNAVNLKIGEDFDIYNTTLLPYYPIPASPIIPSGWSDTLPQTAICPTNTPAKIAFQFGVYPDSMQVPDGMWNSGNFYMWVNYTMKPEIDGEAFTWEPPFYYIYSGFGFPVNQTHVPELPPWINPSDPSVLYNICSSGAGSQGVWDTCTWIGDYPKWRGKVQVWIFGNDVFADGVVPWEYPAVANPTGDLTPTAIAGFPPDAQLQVYSEHNFTYIAP